MSGCRSRPPSPWPPSPSASAPSPGRVRPAPPTYATVNGQGSTYAALAFQQWTQAEQLQGLNVNYTATGSPAGLQAYAGEHRRLRRDRGRVLRAVRRHKRATVVQPRAPGLRLHPRRGRRHRHHVPRLVERHRQRPGRLPPAFPAHGRQDLPRDHHQLGQPDNHRRQQGPGPAERADQRRLSHRPVGDDRTLLRLREAHRPDRLRRLGHSHKFPTTTGIWEIDDGTGFPPTDTWNGYPGSTQQAQAVASPGGLWSIGYDEFGYAKVYHDDVAWIENASGQWVQPYALNIAAALQTAVLAPDTSQTLINVYASTNPLAYPISAYSYILYQCAPTPATTDLQVAVLQSRGHEHHGQIHAIYRMYRPDQDGDNRLLAAARPAEPVHGERHRIHDRPGADNPHSQELRQPAVPREGASGSAPCRPPTRPPTSLRRLHRGSSSSGAGLVRGSQVRGEGHGQGRRGQDVEREDAWRRRG